MLCTVATRTLLSSCCCSTLLRMNLLALALAAPPPPQDADAGQAGRVAPARVRGGGGAGAAGGRRRTDNLERPYDLLAARLDRVAGTDQATPRFDLYNHEQAYALKANHKLFDLLGTPAACSDIIVLGNAKSKTEEIKHVCELPPGPCNVMSIGSNGQFAFEQSVADRLGCNVTTFDCTVDRPVKIPRSLRTSLSFFYNCFGKPPTPNRSQFLYVPEQRWSKRYFKAAHLEPTAFLTYNELLTKMYGTNPRAPPLVKMDIEGYEWDMIPEVVQSRFRPLQLQFELHLQTQMPGLTWFGRTKSAAEVLALSMLLKDAGYRMAHRKDNPWCARCTELLYVL